MELTQPGSRPTILPPDRRTLGAAREQGQTIEDPRQPHCADHARFVPGCGVCKQACANFQPYPMRKSAPAPRSFGYTDNITKEMLEVGSTRWGDPPDEIGLSLLALRFILRLIWPFGRIL